MVRTLAVTGNDERTVTHVQRRPRRVSRAKFVFGVTISSSNCSHESTQLLGAARVFIRQPA